MWNLRTCSLSYNLVKIKSSKCFRLPTKIITTWFSLFRSKLLHHIKIWKKKFHHAAFSDFLKTRWLSQNYCNFLLPGKPTSSTIDRFVHTLHWWLMSMTVSNLPRARCFSAWEVAMRIGYIRSTVTWSHGIPEPRHYWLAYGLAMVEWSDISIIVTSMCHFRLHLNYLH